MDLGIITSEGVGEAQAATSINAVGSDPFGINISKSVGSGHLKQQRSGTCLQDSWRAGKLPRPNEFGSSFFSQNPTTLLRSGSMIPTTNGQTMISFSSQSQTPLFTEEDGVKTSAFPFFLSPSQEQQLSSKTSGHAAEKAAEAIRGPFARFRGPFTPSQWMELEHQALIYKHILANVPVPSHLLIPLKKSFNPYAFTGFSPGSYGSSSLVGWGSFHLGFAGSTDPEPGRCRRTDGKKWRCSRDAVPDQKYCERHINRGRHRSRKPVEGQTGHAVSGSTVPKVAPNASSSSASVMSSSNASNCLGAVQHQFKPAPANTPNEHLASRMQDLQGQGISMLGDSMNLKSKDSSFSSQKPHGLLGGLTQAEFGIVSPHSLLNPSQKSSRMNSGETDSFTSFNEQDVHGHHPLRHFIDNWPKDHSDRGSVTWPEELKSDWTQLSMSIPVSSSSSNSPPQEKTTLSPLRLAREIDHIQMGLSVNNNDVSEQNQKQQHSNWLPVSWGSCNSSSLGGPLGEVLNSTTYSSVVGGSKNSSAALNLMTQVWGDGNSPQMGCSPTAVLQKSTFVSLSNSSSGSSPRGDNHNNNNNNNNNNNKKAPKNASLCDDILGSTLASSASIPSI